MNGYWFISKRIKLSLCSSYSQPQGTTKDNKTKTKSGRELLVCIHQLFDTMEHGKGFVTLDVLLVLLLLSMRLRS